MRTRGPRYHADWSDSRDHFRRLLSEFIGVFGLVFVLSFGSAILYAYAQPRLSNVATGVIIAGASSLWLVASIYALGDISSHFNPAVTLAYALRGDMSWRRATMYWGVQLTASVTAALLALAWFGAASGLGGQEFPAGAALPALGFEAMLMGGFVLLLLLITQGPKLNGPFTPLAVAAYIMALGMVGGLYEGAAINPARAFGPLLVTGQLGRFWVYLIGDVLGAVVAVGLDRTLRGPANQAEAETAEHGQPGN